MEIFIDINWVAVIIGAIVAFALGAVWYSEKLFGKKWKAGIGAPAVPNIPMWYGMTAQAFGTFLLAWVIGVDPDRII